MKTTLFVYGQCPMCHKVHSQSVHSIIDDSDLKKECECGNEIIWHEMIHHNYQKPTDTPKKKEQRIKRISPTSGFEICLLVFTCLLLILIDVYLYFDIQNWSPMGKWAFIGTAVIITVSIWILERSFMIRIIDDYTFFSREEGWNQGGYLERSDNGKRRGKEKKDEHSP